jgi:hypothetical protein
MKKGIFKFIFPGAYLLVILLFSWREQPAWQHKLLDITTICKQDSFSGLSYVKTGFCSPVYAVIISLIIYIIIGTVIDIAIQRYGDSKITNLPKS